jgi:hypothetical protein
MTGILRCLYWIMERERASHRDSRTLGKLWDWSLVELALIIRNSTRSLSGLILRIFWRLQADTFSSSSIQNSW